MKKSVISLAAGAVAFVALAGTGYAQDGSEAAATQAKLKVASGVIAIGRADKDPMMLVVGAKLLTGLGAGAKEGDAGDASNAFDVSEILDEAKTLAGDNEYLLGEIADLAGRPERGERYCNWYTNCGYSIVDPYACEEVMVCD